MPEIHPDWDTEKSTAHLEDLRTEIGKLEAVHDAFTDAADDAWRDLCTRRDQLAYCERMFSAPRSVKKTAS